MTGAETSIVWDAHIGGHPVSLIGIESQNVAREGYRRVRAQDRPVVFLLWGAYAQKKAGFIRSVEAGGKHLVLKAAHPSPLSAHNGFFGCRHFSKANAFLQAQGRSPIDWALPADAGEAAA